MLIALLRGSKDSAPVSHAKTDVGSLCAALSKLTGVVRELKSELKTIRTRSVSLSRKRPISDIPAKGLIRV